MVVTKAFKMGHNGIRRIGYGRLTFSVFLLAFFIGPLFLQQNTGQARAASVEAKSLKRSKCSELGKAFFQKSLITANAPLVSPPAMPVVRVAFFQGGDKTEMECIGDCPNNFLECTTPGSIIKGQGCCARCCWENYPSNCSYSRCCGDDPEIQ